VKVDPVFGTKGQVGGGLFRLIDGANHDKEDETAGCRRAKIALVALPEQATVAVQRYAVHPDQRMRRRAPSTRASVGTRRRRGPDKNPPQP
jgi:hypothetical protein